MSAVSVECRETKSAPATSSSRRLRPLDPELPEALGRDVRVEGEDAHLEPARAPGDLLADPAEADEPERLVGELEPGEAGALPAPLLERAVCLRDLAGEGEQQPEGVLGRRHDRGLRGVGDDDPALRRGGEIDVVHPHPGPADHLEAVGALDQVGRQLRRAADDDRVVVADRRRQVAVGLDVDVESLSQKVDAGLGDRLPDENFHAATGSACASSAAGIAAPRSTSAPASTSARSSAASAAATSWTST